MHAKQQSTLTTIITTANGWQATAKSAGITIGQLNFTLSDNASIILVWDKEAAGGSDWIVLTGTDAQLTPGNPASN